MNEKSIIEGPINLKPTSNKYLVQINYEYFEITHKNWNQLGAGFQKEIIREFIESLTSFLQGNVENGAIIFDKKFITIEPINPESDITIQIVKDNG